MALNAVIRKASFLTLVIYILTVVVLTGCRKSSPDKSSSSGNSPAAGTVSGSGTSEPSKAVAEIISRRRGWNPILTNYYGKEMSDFKVKDINGQAHSLSACRGKNVLVVIWATWCLPCVQEVPHLMALREIMPEDKLAILAISNESIDVVRAMAEKKNMSYTVISHRDILPAPFSSTRSVPSCFFIRPDGTLKLATEGSLYLGDLKSIILAE